MNVGLVSALVLGYVVTMQAMVFAMSPFSDTHSLSQTPISGPLVLSGGAGSEVASTGSYESGSQGYLSSSNEKKAPTNISITPALAMIIAGEEYCARKQPDYCEAYKCFKLASAQTQDLRAQAWGNYYQGIIFLRGDYVDQDNDTAHKFLKLAAKQEVDQFLRLKAFFSLGKFYYTVGLQPQDYEMLKASRLCFLQVIHGKCRTADLANELAEANLMLGWEYEDGLGVLRDHTKAYEHYQQAATIDEKSRISVAAKIHLCDLEHNVYKNYGKALRYSEQVVQQTAYPDCRAQALLRQGSLYREGGYGIIRNAVLAYKCLTEVVNQKDDLGAAQEAQKILNYPDLRHMQNKEKSD